MVLWIKRCGLTETERHSDYTQHGGSLIASSGRCPSDALAEKTSLQTFFRGNKLRYFQVETSETTAGLDKTPERTDSHLDIASIKKTRRAVESPDQQRLSTSPLPPDLETLRDFHHFTTTTSITLPVDDLHASARYWHGDVVEQQDGRPLTLSRGSHGVPAQCPGYDGRSRPSSPASVRQRQQFRDRRCGL